MDLKFRKQPLLSKPESSAMRNPFSSLWPCLDCVCVTASVTCYSLLWPVIYDLLLTPCVSPSLQGRTFLVSDQCLQHAFSLHHSLCASLLLAYQGLFGYFTSVSKDLPSSHRMELGRPTLHHGNTRNSQSHTDHIARWLHGEKQCQLKWKESPGCWCSTDVMDLWRWQTGSFPHSPFITSVLALTLQHWTCSLIWLQGLSWRIRFREPWYPVRELQDIQLCITPQHDPETHTSSLLPDFTVRTLLFNVVLFSLLLFPMSVSRMSMMYCTFVFINWLCCLS